MKRPISLILAFSFLVSFSVAQVPPQSKSEYKKEYERRIKMTRIAGVYIPKNAEEAVVELKRLADAKDLVKFKVQEEDHVANKLHFGLGRWIRVNWSLYEGSRYAHYLKELGVTYPDDMSDLTTRIFHRSLNSLPLDVENLAKQYAEKRQKEFQEKMKKGDVIHEEKRSLKK